MQDFSVTIAPRFYETDALGHINNASIAAWFELVRMEFIEAISSESPGLDANWVLAALNIDFVAEVFHGAEVTARVTGASAGNTSLSVVSEMYQREKLCVRGTAVMVFLDADTRKPTSLTDSLRKAIQSY